MNWLEYCGCEPFGWNWPTIGCGIIGHIIGGNCGCCPPA